MSIEVSIGMVRELQNKFEFKVVCFVGFIFDLLGLVALTWFEL